MINACWKLFTWCLGLGLVGALAVFGYTYFQLDEEVRRRAEELLSRHYSNLQVEVGSAQFLKGRGVKLYELRVSDPRATGQADPLLEVEEALLICPTQWEDLISGEFRIQRVVAKRARLHATRGHDGTWNVRSLWPPPALGDQPPSVEVSDGTLILSHASTSVSAGLAVPEIDLMLTPEVTTQAADAAPGSVVRTYHIEASAAGNLARQLRIEGRASPDDGHLDLALDVHDLELSPEIVTAISAIGQFADPSVQVNGLANGKLHVSRSADGAQVAKVQGSFSLRDGRLSHKLLPRPITELNVEGHCEGDRCFIQLLTGMCGTAEVQLACERVGWGPKAPLGLHAKVLGLSLDEELYVALPQSLRRQWNRYAPAGQVDADLVATFDGFRWLPKLTLECRQLAFTAHEQFPYRVEQSVGTFTFEQTPDQPGGELTIDMLGMGHGCPVHLVATVTNIPSHAEPGVRSPTTKPLGWAEVTASGMSVHERLIDAMPPQAQKVVRSLNPEGEFDFRWRGERLAPSETRLETTLEITLRRGTIQYEHFPYPLREITGKVLCRNDVWQFVDLESCSLNGNTIVTAHGGLHPTDDGRQLQLTVSAQDIALDDRLRSALNPEMQTVWTQLNPQGRIDFTAVVNHQSRQGQSTKPDVRVVVQPHGDSVSLEPTFLPYPYRLELLAGRFDYEGGALRMTDVRARHGRVEIATQGAWNRTEEGGWRLRFDGLSADHLTASRDLLLALPTRLQKALDGLQPTGMFSLYNSTFEFTKPAEPTARLTSRWDLNLECQQSDLRAGVLLEDVSGSVRLVGMSDGQEGFTAGELMLDSLIWNNVQFTSIRGPLWIDQTPAGSIVQLGRGAANRGQQRGQPPRRISARVYGGDVLADVEVRNEGIPRVTLIADLAGADLTQYALERLGGRADVTGTINGRLRLDNTGTSTDAMTGGGELHLVDAHIYRLPQLVALLKVLQIQAPDTTAFNACDSKFTIQGKHLAFQKLDLLGDAVSLYGSGESSLDGNNLNLVFKTEMGRRGIPVVSSISRLWGEAQAQLVRLRVGGSARNPSFTFDPLPGMRKTLESIPGELPPAMVPESRQAESRFPLWPFR